MDIHNSIMDIYNYMLAIMDIHNSIMGIHNSIMDIHNSIVGGGGGAEAWLTLGHAPLNSHRCCPTAVPSLVEQLPCISIQTARIGLKFGGRTPDGTARACPGGPASPDQSVHPCSYPFRQKRDFFNGKRKFSKSRKRGSFYF